MAKPPDYNLSILDKTDESRGTIGAGWANDDGSISLTLNPGTFLVRNPNQALRLFPAGQKPETRRAPKPSTSEAPF